MPILGLRDEIWALVLTVSIIAPVLLHCNFFGLLSLSDFELLKGSCHIYLGISSAWHAEEININVLNILAD